MTTDGQRLPVSKTDPQYIELYDDVERRVRPVLAHWPEQDIVAVLERIVSFKYRHRHEPGPAGHSPLRPRR